MAPVFCLIALFAQLLLVQPAAAMPLAQAGTSMMVPQPAPASPAPPSAAPATQPAGNNRDLISTLQDTELGRMAAGQKPVNLREFLTFRFWLKCVEELTGVAVLLIPRIIAALLFLLLFWGIYRGIRRVSVGSMSKANVDSSIRDMLGSLLRWAIMGFGVVIACNQIGVQITALLTGVSIIGLAIGFAAQETLANFIAGIVIFWDRPFKVGDWIAVDGHYAEVQRITFRSTRMLTMDGDMLVMPNTAMLSSKLSNHSANPVNRIKVPIGIAYREPIDEARRALLELVKGDPRICAEPAPVVVVAECAASSVNLELRFWVQDESIERKIFHEYLEKSKLALDRAGIEIPFPQVVVTTAATEPAPA